MVYFISGKKQLFTDNDIQECNIQELFNWLNNKNNINIGLDLETTGFNPLSDRILTYQLGNKDVQFVVDAQYYNILNFKDYFTDNKRLFLGQNLKFDLRFLYHAGIDIFKIKIYDTFLAECILNTGKESAELGLDSIVWKYCNVKLDKSIRGDINRLGLSSKVIKYAADDIVYLEDVMNLQMIQLVELNLLNTLNLENEVVKVFSLMEYNGVKLDVIKWKEVAKTVEANSKELYNKLNSYVLSEETFSKFRPKGVQTTMFGVEEQLVNINWSSNQQKLEICKKVEPSLPSVGDRELSRIKHRHPLIKTLIDFNKSKKLETAFGNNFLKFVDVDGRVHTQIWQILSTGRISVSDPNLNQIPSKGDIAKVIRSCFIPEKGCKIVGGDFSGMELRIIAEFSKDEVWLNAFKNGDDLHSVLCAMTFNIPITDVKKESPFKKGVTYRDIQKTINFGLAYGMSEFKLADTMEISVEEAKNIINRFFKAVPKVEKFLTGLGRLAKTRGYIKTPAPYARIRWFEQWENAVETGDFKKLGEIERAGKNTPIQGANGDIIKQALIDVQTEIYKNNWPVKIILAVYDELQTECEESRAEEWRIKLNELMINAAKNVLKEVPIVVDCSISDYWKK
jgi:DNA polymerase-1